MTADKAELWFPTIRLLRETQGRDGHGLERRTNHDHPTSGRRVRRKIDTDYAEAAGRIAEVDGPVTLIWSREEDTRRDRFRPAFKEA